MKVVKYILLILFFGFIVTTFILAIIPNPPCWTGFGERKINPDIEPGKTLFDWLELLIIPVTIAIIGWLFKDAETKRKEKKEIENRRTKIVDSFFDFIKDISLGNKFKREDKTKVTAIIRAKLITALSQIDGDRKGHILQFLFESGLISKNPTLNLNGVDFKDSILDNVVIIEAEIKGVYFSNSSIKNSRLEKVNFAASDFKNCDFSGSRIKDVNFEYCNLTGADLREIDLTSINFEGVNMTQANLSNSIITQKQLDLIKEKEGINLFQTKIK